MQQLTYFDRFTIFFLLFKVDDATSAYLSNVIRTERQQYDSLEIPFLQRGREFFKMCNDDSRHYRVFKSRVPGLQIKAVHFSRDSALAGVSSAVIDADVATCLSYEFRKESREAVAARKSNRIVEEAVHYVNKHSHLYRRVGDLGIKGLFNREFRMKGVWKIYEESGKALLAYEDSDELDDRYPRFKIGRVAASARTACMFEPLPTIHGIPQTRVTFVGRVDVSFFRF